MINKNKWWSAIDDEILEQVIMENRIVELELKERALIYDLVEIRNQLVELRIEEFLRKRNLKIGDFIEFVPDKKIFRGQVCEVEVTSYKPAYLRVKLLDKNGKVGNREVRIWNWLEESIKKIEL